MQQMIAVMYAQMQETTIRHEKELKRHELERREEREQALAEAAATRKMDRELATQAMEAADRRHREDQARMREEMDLKLEAADRYRERRETNARLTTLIPKYTEPCDMGCYLLGFEQVLTSEGIPVREWPTYLLSALKGKAAELMVTVVPIEHRDSYAATKTNSFTLTWPFPLILTT